MNFPILVECTEGDKDEKRFVNGHPRYYADALVINDRQPQGLSRHLAISPENSVIRLHVILTYVIGFNILSQHICFE